ncbi:MAG: hypothetical protein WCO02_13555 [Bacteroidota bacterium]
MIDKKLIEKIHGDLDGILTPSEQQELRDRLSADPEASAYYNDWQKIQKNIASCRELTPEIDFTKEILNRLPMEPQAAKKPEPLIRPSFWNRPAFRYSFVFITGVLIGFLSFTFLWQGTKQSKAPAFKLKGALYDTRGFDQMTMADNLVFENPMVKATFAVKYSTSVVEARITISSLYPVQAVLLFDYNSLQAMNVMNVSVNDQSSISASSNFVQINNSGNNQYVVQLLNKNSLPQQINIKILQNDVPMYQNSVTVNRE